MKNILGLATRNAKAHWTRFALTSVAVVLSVAFLTATLVLTDSMTGTATSDVADAYQDVDVVLEGRILIEADGGGPGELAEPTRQDIADGTLAVAIDTPGVASAVGVRVGFAKLVDGGRAIGAGTPLDLGANWVSNQRLNPFELVEGKPPLRSGEIVIDQRTAADAGLLVGDHVEVLTATGLHAETIVGLSTFGSEGNAPFRRSTFFAEADIDLVLGNPSVSQILIETEANISTVGASSADTSSAGASSAGILASLSKVFPEDDVRSGSEFIADQQALVSSPFAFISVFLSAFAAIATVVGMTVIYNTFAIAVTQRRQELALLRAIGATRRQVLVSIMIEAALIGSVATLIGLGLGIGSVGVMRNVMSWLGLTFLEGPTLVSMLTLVIAGGVGVGVTLLSAYFPARAVASVAPVEALRSSAAEAGGGSALRTLSGLMLLALGGAATVLSVVWQSTGLLTVGILLIPGLVVSGPTVIGAVVAAARPVLGRAAGVEGFIAARNLARSPRRAASTSLSLTLGVGLISFFAIVASTMSASVTGSLDTQLSASNVVVSVTPDAATIDPALANELGQIEGVVVAAVAQVDGLVDGETATLAGMSSASMAQLFDLGLMEGSLEELDNGGIAVVVDSDSAGMQPSSTMTDDSAASHSESAAAAGSTSATNSAEVSVDLSAPVGLGDMLEVQLGGDVVQFPVVALVEKSLGGFDAPTHFVSEANFAELRRGVLDNIIYLHVPNADALEKVQDEVASTPGSLLETRSIYLANSSSEVDSFRNLIYSMLGLTLVIAIAGVANTMTLAIHERSREIGLLRAVGTTTVGIRRMVRLEATLLSATGALLGTGMAILGSWAMVRVVGGSDLSVLSIPGPTLAVIAFGAIAAGTMASAFPAWRVSQVPVLRAIAQL